MTNPRILRRASSADGRVPLGAKPIATAPRSAPRIESQPACAAPMPDARLQHIQQLEAQIAQLRDERDRLRTDLESHTAQIEDARARARRDGYAEGQSTAQRELERDRAACIAEWRSTVEQYAQQQDGRLQAWQAELTEIVSTAVAKLLGDHVVSPNPIRAAIEQTLREAGIGSPIRVLIASLQFEQLTRHGASHMAAFRERRIDVAPDARVGAGGCLIETSTGIIDGRFETQLAKLRQVIAGHARSTGP